MSDISERVRKVLAAQFDIEKAELVPETSIVKDLGADSLDVIEISLAFEKEFKIKFTDDDVESIKTIGDAEKFIANTQ